MERLIININICLFSAITGFIGIQQAIPPGYATAIWMPSGIALAYILNFRFRVLPGILFGSFITLDDLIKNT